MIEAKEMNDVAPLCPHCSEVIREVWFRTLGSAIGGVAGTTVVLALVSLLPRATIAIARYARY